MTPITSAFDRSISDVVETVFLTEASSSVRSSTPRRRASAATQCGASDRLVAAHYYLCKRGARKFWRSGLERSDLEQVAAIGLIKAARRYDERTATPFEAYAWLMIVGELMHYVRDHERPVRLPRRLRSLERHYARAHDALVGRHGREPGDGELAVELGVLEPTVRELRRSRDTAVTVGLDVLERTSRDDGGLDCDDRLLIESAFRDLSIVERRIIVGVYVLGLTQLELGRRLGISAKRVSRAHHIALRRMQRAWAS